MTLQWALCDLRTLSQEEANNTSTCLPLPSSSSGACPPHNPRQRLNMQQVMGI